MELCKRAELRASLVCLVIFIALITPRSVWGAISIDARAFGDGASASTTVSCTAFSTTVSNELLLAFVSTDSVSGTNTTVKSVAGGGLTWVLVKRTNAQKGTSEV